MKKIVITGGKGGTGKSTVAILLANKLLRQGQKIVLADLDVECPNDYLLLGQKLAKPAKIASSNFPQLDKSKCQKCGLCVKVCYNNTVFQQPGEYPVFLRNLCSGCGTCWLACPHQAIKKIKEKVGDIYLNKIRQDFYLVTGLAKPGLGKTGLVVSDTVAAQTKEYALTLAKKIKADLVIFDTAAGTHCPVITGILDSDMAYAVTEPTPMGAYDLDLILDLCQKLKVPAKVILNQANLGNKEPIQKIVKKYKTKIVKSIPFSKKIVEAYSKGELLKLETRL